MRGYFGLAQISEDEKSNILSQHKHIYNGYRTMQPNVSNTQPLYVQDYANDKGGITVNSRGEVKPYMNKGINEQVKEVCDECGAMQMEEEMCNECGGKLYEGECSECGWKGEVGEETGHLDDIYHEEDLNPNAEFDYTEGGGNKYGTFEKAHHMKRIKEQTELDELGTHELKKGKKYKFDFPSVEDEIEFDIESNDDTKGEKMYQFKSKKHGAHLLPGKHIEDYVSDIDEQGGNADDMDVDNVLPPFNFATDGPMAGGDVYPVNEYDVEDEFEIKSDKYRPRGHEKLKTGDKLKITKKWKNAAGDVFGTDRSEDDYGLDFDDIETLKKYEPMESAWAEDMDENDVSGVQGIYGDMKSAYDFDSEGPGKAGPYQDSSYGGSSHEDEDAYWDEDLEDDELDIDLTKFNPEDKSWEEITAHTGDDEFAHIDEDLKESLIIQKNRIMEMMNRMKIIK